MKNLINLIIFLFVIFGMFMIGRYSPQNNELYDIQNILRVCEASKGWMWNISMSTTSVSYDCTAIHCNDGKCRFDYLKKVKAERIDGRWLVEV